MHVLQISRPLSPRERGTRRGRAARRRYWLGRAIDACPELFRRDQPAMTHTPDTLARDSDDIDHIRFDPPLWRQRRSLVSSLLAAHNVQSVVDYGCGEGALLEILLNSTQFDRLIGLDISEESLYSACETCYPTDNDFRFLRELPIVLDLYLGSVDRFDSRLTGHDALVSLEVIEHLDPPVLEAYPEIVFGRYQPRLVIVTTPNAEFNVFFPNLNYGTPHATLRNDDHRFEWTRREFETWAQSIALDYGYAVSFTGVGYWYNDEKTLTDIGFCTQVAIFQRNEPDPAAIAPVDTTAAPNESASTTLAAPLQCSPPGTSSSSKPSVELASDTVTSLSNLPSTEPAEPADAPQADPDTNIVVATSPIHSHILFESIGYPFFDEPALSGSELLDLIKQEATDLHHNDITWAHLSRSPLSTEPEIDASGSTINLSLGQLWSVLKVRQHCKHIATLVDALRTDLGRDLFELYETDSPSSDLGSHVEDSLRRTWVRSRFLAPPVTWLHSLEAPASDSDTAESDDESIPEPPREKRDPGPAMADWKTADIANRTWQPSAAPWPAPGWGSEALGDVPADGSGIQGQTEAITTGWGVYEGPAQSGAEEGGWQAFVSDGNDPAPTVNSGWE
ncbi:uncharacterized protein BJ171DRAFT_486976 [Polychytrium aggregatum]|uniref:uncharacterized protein n=1 Tax=Polychytrium aggregatum TaxID=110093 RepID=UPI0022FF43DE|nr:uncharacterized protein BJ171DRAFT_486976 [Polychytrium aggregatum]KAI9209427.1 hypothetical protein BJ171DRAFT_486976 [Polychytrium aggregatum]